MDKYEIKNKMDRIANDLGYGILTIEEAVIRLYALSNEVVAAFDDAELLDAVKNGNQ